MEQKHESDLTPKEKRRLEWEKIRGLSWPKRLEYFWNYYKIVPVLLVVVILVCSFAWSMIQNLRTETLLSIGIMDVNYEVLDQTEVLKQELKEVLGTGSKYEEVELDTALSGSTEDYTAAVKLTTVLASGSLDVLFCGQEKYEELKGQGAFLDWEAVLGEDYAKYEPYLTDGVIDMSKSSRWVSAGWTTYTPTYAGVVHSTEHTEAVKAMLNYFFP